jgi:hypothetical protein
MLAAPTPDHIHQPRNTVAIFDINQHPPPIPAHYTPMSLASATAYVITMPPKVWRPRPPSRYIPLDYGDEIDDDMFIFRQYGRSLLRPPYGKTIPERDDIILWDSSVHQAEFDEVITIPDHVPDNIKAELTSIIHDNWDCFIAEGVYRPVLGFEFRIDTGGATPVCCKNPSYGIHKGPIMQKSIDALLANNWIRRCGGPWGCKGILAGKPHQEDVWNIDDYIWRFCVNFRPLNAVTLAFEFPIPRCDTSMDDFGDADGTLWLISVDGKSGFHQIQVALSDQEKLTFLHRMDTSTASR